MTHNHAITHSNGNRSGPPERPVPSHRPPARFPTPTQTPGFLLRPNSAPPSPIDGSWFPWTANLTDELDDLISALTLRLGPVARVCFDWNALQISRKRIDEFDLDSGGIALREPAPGQPPHTMYFLGCNGTQLVLVLLSPDTEPDHAYGIMRTLADS